MPGYYSLFNAHLAEVTVDGNESAEVGGRELRGQRQAEEECVPRPVPDVARLVHVQHQLRKDEELGLEVDPGLDEEQVQQRLVLLHEDADVVEERNEGAAELRILSALARSEETAERSENLLVDQDGLGRAGEDFRKEFQQHDPDLLPVDFLSGAEHVDALDDVLAQDELQAVAGSAAGRGLLLDDLLLDGREVATEVLQREGVGDLRLHDTVHGFPVVLN